MNKIKWYSTTNHHFWTELEYVAENADPQSTIETTGQTDQSIDGFGGCFNELGGIALEKLSEQDREALMDLLFAPDGEGLRLNYNRLPIGASDYAESWYSYDEAKNDYAMEHFSIERDKAYLLPYLQAGLKRNPSMTLFSSPWSPPTWMKFPQAYNYGRLVWTKENLEAYALYFAKYIEAYAKENIKIDQIHIQNEPFADQKFPSCLWSGEQFREFIGCFMGPLFDKLGLNVEIFLGTLNGDENNYDEYANNIFHDPEASRYVKGVSYQWAGKYSLAITHESWPEKTIIQSENECGDGRNDWNYARYIFRLFRHYLSNGVNAYVYWNMILEKDGMSTWGWTQNSMITVNEDATYTLNPEFYVMKHFSRFICPGAKRLCLKGHWTGSSVAFQNPDGSTVLVTQNPYKEAKTVSFTHEGQQYTFTLPSDSFNTIVL
ncbi:MAG: glycosyl hydrolase [Herbinix sp.]|jgi:glucosylceramidase|nr:glycosyl hydrolase [Herbinix sp.]